MQRNLLEPETAAEAIVTAAEALETADEATATVGLSRLWYIIGPWLAKLRKAQPSLPLYDVMFASVVVRYRGKNISVYKVQGAMISKWYMRDCLYW